MPVNRPETEPETPPMSAARILQTLEENSAGTLPPGSWAKWLAAEMREDLYARLDQAGRTPETAVRLSKVFIDVAASTTGGDEERESGDEERAADALAMFHGGESESASFIARARTGVLRALLGANIEQPASAEARPRARRMGLFGSRHLAAELNARARSIRDAAQRRFLLIGGPGQGKSTITQLLCQVHRSAILTAYGAHLDKDTKRQVAELATETHALDVPTPVVTRLPVRIILRDFAAWLFREGQSATSPLLEYIAGRIGKRIGLAVPTETLSRSFRAVPWLLVLDGLDEVPASGGREDVLMAVRSFLSGLLEKTPGLVVATTRPQGYHGELGEFSEVRLMGLSRARMIAYASRLVNCRYPGQSERQSEILERLESAWSEATGRRLLRTALQVTLMADLAATVGRIPSERWKLFADYFRVMYLRETERPNLQQGALLRRLKTQITQIHQRAGLWLQIRSENAGGTEALLSYEELRGLIDSVLREDYPDDRERANLVAEVLLAAVERLVFLVHAEDGRYGFEIRSLQEWMAAEALLSGGDEDIKARLRHVAPVSAWRNVVLFAAGKCFAELWHLRDFVVDGLCLWLNDGCEIPEVQKTLLGSGLALDILEDGAAREQRRLSQALASIALRYLEWPYEEVPHRLVTIGMREFDAALQGAVKRLLSSQEPSRRDMGWKMTLDAMDAGASWAVAVANKSWPESGEERRDVLLRVRREWRELIIDGEEEDRTSASGQWVFEKIHAAPLDFPPHVLKAIHIPYGLPDTSPYLDFVRYLGGYYEGVSHALALEVNGQDTGIRGAFSPIAGRHWPDSIADAPTGYQGAWGHAFVAGRFARDPTVERLASELLSLADHVEGEVPADFAHALPWPVAQAIRQSRSASDLRALAADLQSGKYGVGDAFVRAENAWDAPVEIDRLLDIAGFWPVPDAAGFRFPLRATFYFRTGTQGPYRPLLQKALSAFHGASGEKRYAAAWLIEDILGKIREDSEESGEENESPTLKKEDILAIVETLGETDFPRPFHVRDLLSEEHISTPLDEIPNQPWNLSWARERLHTSLSDPDTCARLHLPPPPEPLRSPSDPVPSAGIFRFQSITLSGFRPMGNLPIVLPSPMEAATDSGQWLIVVGENGVGKSTLLRGLVFALGDASAATGALAKSPASYRRTSTDPAQIKVECSTGTLTAKIDQSADGGRDALSFDRIPGSSRPFLVAYGCQRAGALGGPEQEASFAAESDVITLFEHTRGLLAGETWLTKLWVGAQKEPDGPASERFQTVIGILKKLLDLTAIDVEQDGLWVAGKSTGGLRVRFAALSDGYLATAGWVIDLMARWMDRARRLGQEIPADFHKTMTGLVLLDEIDVHLHPRWQLHVLSDVRDLFPRLSFVVTTHHSLTLLGARPGEILILTRHHETHEIEARQIDLPKGLRADQVLTGEWFGLASTMDPETLRLLDDHRKLLRARTPEDDPGRVALEAELRKRLGRFGETAIDRLVQSVAAEITEETARDPSPEERASLRDRVKRLAMERLARANKAPSSNNE